jgi:multidrug efflux pump subunit AcrB
MGSPGGNRPDAGTAKLQSDPDNSRHHCMDLGLSAGQIATQLRLAIDGEVPAKLREGKDETDIRVRLADLRRPDEDV